MVVEYEVGGGAMQGSRGDADTLIPRCVSVSGHAPDLRPT
jgi:hypothetical protein